MLFRCSRFGFTLLVTTLLAGCTGLGALNAVLPKDHNTDKVLSDISYGDDSRQKLDVYLPKRNTRDKTERSVVMFVYGGSWTSGRRQDYEFVGHALASHGYLAVLPDYRLVPEVQYPEFVLDGARALRWVHDNIAAYGGDPDKLFVAGHSAGAYNAIMLTVADQLLDQYGLSVPPVLGGVGLAGPYNFLPLRGDITNDAFASADDLPSTQPVNLVSPKTPPLLLLHGTEDQRVDIQNSRSLYRIASAYNDQTELREYEGVGHARILLAISKPLRHSAPTLQDMTTFIDGILARQSAARRAAIEQQAQER